MSEKLECWEDSLILAIRDLQWIKKNKWIYASHLFELGQPKPNFKQICLGLLKSLKKAFLPPSLFAKLDGRAESASGDSRHPDSWISHEQVSP